MTTECRVERHVIKPSDPGYSLIRDFCKASKNLYNQANYMVRQAFMRINCTVWQKAWEPTCIFCPLPYMK